MAQCCSTMRGCAEQAARVFQAATKQPRLLALSKRFTYHWQTVSGKPGGPYSSRPRAGARRPLNRSARSVGRITISDSACRRTLPHRQADSLASEA